jgi:hypothetical protein
MNVYEMSAEELYDAFFKNVDPGILLHEGRTSLAARLQIEQKLKQESAFYAADEVLSHAQWLLDNQQQE